MRRAQLHEKAVQPGRPAQGNKTAASSKIRTIYARLIKAFGPQGWWPVTPRGKTFPAYAPGFYGRLPERGVFEICVGAVLTQNTAWKNVEKALEALGRAGLMSPRKMAVCRLAALERAIRPSGYFRQKAGRLKGFSARVLREHPEGLRSWLRSVPAGELRRELLSHKGIGPETADCIVLYAAGKAGFVIDAYTRRIVSRAGAAAGLSYDGWKALFERSLPPDVKMYNEYHALLVRLGKDFCRKTRPLCASCPIENICDKNI